MPRILDGDSLVGAQAQAPQHLQIDIGGGLAARRVGFAGHNVEHLAGQRRRGRGEDRIDVRLRCRRGHRDRQTRRARFGDQVDDARPGRHAIVRHPLLKNRTFAGVDAGGGGGAERLAPVGGIGRDARRPARRAVGNQTAVGCAVPIPPQPRLVERGVECGALQVAGFDERPDRTEDNCAQGHGVLLLKPTAVTRPPPTPFNATIPPTTSRRAIGRAR